VIRRRTAVAWLAVMAAGAASSRAARADVAWEAPAACPDRDAFLARIEVELGRRFDPAAVDIGGRIDAAGGRWRIALRLGAGERVVEARSCAELVATAALIVALAIDAGEVIEMAAVIAAPVAVASARTDDDEVPPVRGLALSAPTPAPAPPPEPLRLDLAVRATVGGDAGGLPALAGGLGGGIELGLGRWSVDGSASRWFGQRATSQPEQGADLDLTTAAIRACRGVVRRPGWRLAGCVGAEIDALRATPFGFDQPASARTLVGGGAVIGAVVARRLAGPLWLRVDAGLSALAWTVGFREGDPASPEMLGPPVHEMSRIVARGFAAAEVRVP
jgi:hypothetical protein